MLSWLSSVEDFVNERADSSQEVKTVSLSDPHEGWRKALDKPDMRRHQCQISYKKITTKKSH